MRLFTVSVRTSYRASQWRPKSLHISPSSNRNSSTASSIADLESSLVRELTSRPPNIIHDYLSPTPSHLLNISLAGFLPKSSFSSHFQPENLHLPGRYDERYLPQGHHLVYFPTQVLSSDLLPDGTDALQSPGAPYTRRMWAGGSLIFSADRTNNLDLDGTRAVCIERITDVKVRGKEGEEKIFVRIERRIGSAGRKLMHPLHDAYDEEWAQRTEEKVAEYSHIPEGELDGLALVEKRNLVFMRDKSREQVQADAGAMRKIIKPSVDPDFSTSITPTQQLLFRFSALSFNAHGIHLDPQYCREVEGYRNLLVHGPLSLTLMLSVLRSQLGEGEMVTKFDYRNLAPLFAEEKMTICVRRAGESKWDVWIEGVDGGYAVKGNAVVGSVDGQNFEKESFEAGMT